MKKKNKRGRKKIEVDFLRFENPIAELYEKNKAKARRYQSFTYQKQAFRAGDFAIINHKREDADPYFCKIVELVLLPLSAEKVLPVLHVQW